MLRDRAILYVDQLEAHLGDGGKYGPNNVSDLMMFVRQLAAESAEIDKLQDALRRAGWHLRRYCQPEALEIINTALEVNNPQKRETIEL